MAGFNSVAVIGAGTWGTALAGIAARAGRDVMLYARNPDTAARVAATRENPK
jgi:glycerol-3-phosphate dehydrogenase (NAD(P)+)